MMAALLMARPIFAAILLAVVGLYVWTGFRSEATRSKDAQSGRKAT